MPLRKRIADENLLRYNGMLIGVFELLADAREQIASVNALRSTRCAISGSPRPTCRHGADRPRRAAAPWRAPRLPQADSRRPRH